ncbi:MAG: DUF3991 and TOPRIM domain-containing protein [Lachnospiraceae bacterium]|nr:DUF3991 and TOPRIM domain-containing protein [Lachnospiraceae bacterium]
MNLSYTEEERQKVREGVSLTALAESMGYHIIKKGTYYSIQEMDSLIIYNDRTWKRWSNKGDINAGSQIDFELAFGESSTVPEAIHKLLDFINVPSHLNDYVTAGSPEITRHAEDCGEMVLPPRNDNYRRVFAYLMKTRGLSQEVVSFFAHNKLIYEEANHHNIVFCGYDPEGKIRYAGMRGTVTYGNTSFKCDVPGNDKNYGVNIINKDSDELKVFESVIDCMSYMDLTEDYYSNKLVLGMVADNPLEQLLKDYGHIKKISFCLDNDEAGQSVIYGNHGGSGQSGYIEKYTARGYSCSVEIPPEGKDWNEFLTDFQSERFERGKYSSENFLKSGDGEDSEENDMDEICFRHKCR